MIIKYNFNSNNTIEILKNMDEMNLDKNLNIILNFVTSILKEKYIFF